MAYQNSPSRATAPKFRTHSSTRNPAFAKAIVCEVFPGKALSLARGGQEFRDRDPDAALQDASEYLDGQQAVVRWLALAMESEGEDAAIAFQTADELR